MRPRRCAPINTFASSRCQRPGTQACAPFWRVSKSWSALPRLRWQRSTSGSLSNPTRNARASVLLQLPHIKAPKRIALPQGLQRLGSVLPAFLDLLATPHQPCHRFFMLGDGEGFSLADTFQKFGGFGLCLESAHDRSYRPHLYRLVEPTGSSSLQPIRDPLCGGPFGTYRGPRASRFTPRHNRSMHTLSSQSPPSIHAHPHASTLQYTRPNSAGELAALIRVRVSRGAGS